MDHAKRDYILGMAARQAGLVLPAGVSYGFVCGYFAAIHQEIDLDAATAAFGN